MSHLALPVQEALKPEPYIFYQFCVRCTNNIVIHLSKLDFTGGKTRTSDGDVLNCLMKQLIFNKFRFNIYSCEEVLRVSSDNWYLK